MFRFRLFLPQNPVAQHVCSPILCKSSGALPRNEQSCVWSWLSRVCDGDLGGDKKAQVFLLWRPWQFSPKLGFHKKKLLLENIGGSWGDFFLCLEKALE